MKTGVWSSIGSLPPLILNAVYKQIKNGEVFRLLGIPMGFHLQPQDRWRWVYDKFFTTIQKWKGYQPSLSSRLFVLNHYILPCLVYYLACCLEAHQVPAEKHSLPHWAISVGGQWGSKEA